MPDMQQTPSNTMHTDDMIIDMPDMRQTPSNTKEVLEAEEDNHDIGLPVQADDMIHPMPEQEGADDDVVLDATLRRGSRMRQQTVFYVDAAYVDLILEGEDILGVLEDFQADSDAAAAAGDMSDSDSDYEYGVTEVVEDTSDSEYSDYSDSDSDSEDSDSDVFFSGQGSRVDPIVIE